MLPLRNMLKNLVSLQKRNTANPQILETGRECVDLNPINTNYGYKMSNIQHQFFFFTAQRKTILISVLGKLIDLFTFSAKNETRILQ